MPDDATPKEGISVDCAVVAENDFIEEYLAGRLATNEAEAFEDHYFKCDGCLVAMKNHAALRAELADMSWQIDVVPERPRLSWRWTWAAAVAALAVGMVLWQWIEAPPQLSEAEMAHLSAVEAPPFTPRQLRGRPDEAERQFRVAMEHYLEGRFAEAIPALEELESRGVRVDFYLGGSYLLTDRLDLAIEALGRVVDSGNARYLESAFFYRGKAYLRLLDVESAIRDFDAVVRLEGDWLAESQSILDQLPR